MGKRSGFTRDTAAITTDKDSEETEGARTPFLGGRRNKSVSYTCRSVVQVPYSYTLRRAAKRPKRSQAKQEPIKPKSPSSPHPSSSIYVDEDPLAEFYGAGGSEEEVGLLKPIETEY